MQNGYRTLRIIDYADPDGNKLDFCAVELLSDNESIN